MFPLISLHINDPKVPGHCNVFPKVLLHRGCFGYVSWRTPDVILQWNNLFCSKFSACKQLHKVAVEELLKFKNDTFYLSKCVFLLSLTPSLAFFLPPSLLSRPASFLSWCVSVTLESKMWVLSKECVFSVPYLSTPPPLLCYSRTFFYSFLFIEHIAAFQLYGHHQPLTTITVLCLFCSDNPRVIHSQLLNWKLWIVLV